MKVRKRVFVTGRVQGVFFRHHTWEIAKSLGVKGFVRNLPDGRVEAVLEGDIDKVDEVLRFMKKGPPLASVTKVSIIDEPYLGEFFDFEVRY